MKDKINFGNIGIINDTFATIYLMTNLAIFGYFFEVEMSSVML